MKPVTDPALLAQLEGGSGGLKPVTDPALLAQLEGKSPVSDPAILEQLNAPQEKPGILSQIGRQVGLTGRYLAEGVPQFADMLAAPIRVAQDAIISGVTGKPYRTAPLSDLGTAASDAVGLPKPEGTLENVVGGASRAVAGAMVPVGIGNSLVNAGRTALNTVPQTFGKMLGSTATGESLGAQPMMQAASAAGGGAGTEVARQADLGPVGEIAFGTAGSFLAPAGVISGRNFAKSEFGQAARRSVGYGLNFSRTRGGEYVARNEAARTMRDNIGSNASRMQVADDIERNAAALSDKQIAENQNWPMDRKPFEPTTGTASGNPVLAGLEKGLASEPNLRARISANQEAIQSNVSAATAPVGAPVERTQNFIDIAMRAKEKPVAKAAEELQGALAQGQQRAANQQAVGGAGNSTVRANASTTAKATGEQLAQAQKGKAQEIYAQVDQELPITFDNTVEAAGKVQSSLGANEAMHPDVARILKSRSENPSSTFGELQSDLRVVNGSLADKNLEPKFQRQLMEVKRGIEADLESAAANNDTLRAANAEYRKYAQDYRSGAAEKVFRDKVPDSATLETYLKTPEGAKQYASTIGSSPEGKKAVREWFVSDLASKPNLSKAAVDKYIRSKSAVLDAFPEVRSEFQKLRNRMGTRAEMNDRLAADLKAKQQELAGLQKERQSGTLGKFVESPSSTIDSMIGSRDGHREFAKLVAEAQRDKSGAAMQGLRNDLLQAIKLKTKNSGKLLSAESGGAVQADELVTSHAGLNKILLEDSNARKMLEMVTSPEDMKTLDRVNRQIAAEERRSRAPYAGSDTADKSALQQIAAATRSLPGYSKPLQGAKLLAGILNLGKTAAKGVLIKDPNKFYNKILEEAMIDPKLGAALLRRDLPEDSPAWKYLAPKLGTIYTQAAALEQE